MFMCNIPIFMYLFYCQKNISLEELVLDILTSHGVIFLVHIKYELQEKEICCI